MKCINCNVAEPNKNSGLCDDCERHEEKNINGVLYLPALGLIASLFFYASYLYDFINAMVAFYQRSGLVTWFAIGCIVFLVIALLVTVWAAWLFFRRKKGTRRAMISRYVLVLIAALYLNFVPVMFFGIAFDTGSIPGLLTAVIGIAVWCPYFIFSKRIAVVFHR